MGLPYMYSRIRSVVLVLLTVLALAGTVSRAQAQAGATVTLQLVSQTPILTPTKTDLRITVRLTNTGATDLASIQIGVVIGSKILTRTDYESSLTDGPGTPNFARTFPVNGPLPAGSSRELSVVVSPTSILGLLDDSQVYPLRVSIRDTNTGVELGGLNSAVIEVVRQPEKPLRLAWTFEVGGGVPALDPQGRASAAIESSLAPPGSLGQQASAMADLAGAGVPFDMAVEPSLLEQVGRMTDGYERVGGTDVPGNVGVPVRAKTVLNQLASAAASRSTELTTEPFAWTSFPAMLQAGLAHDLATQNFLGRTTLSQVLGVPPDPAVVRPPMGALNDQSLHTLISRNVSVVLAQPDTVVRPPQPNDFAPPASAVIQQGSTSATLVLPDPGTQALLDDPTLAQDPVRAAQITLGELATVWKQQPVPSGDAVRGVALTLRGDLPAAFWGAFTNRVAKASFLDPVTATKLIAQVPPAATQTELQNAAPLTFRAPYVNALRTARGHVAAFRSMLPSADPQPDRLDRNLLVAESSAFLTRELTGRTWISAVRETTDLAFACAMPPPDQEFTFTKLSGSILLTLGPLTEKCDPALRPINVTVELQSARMTFPDGSTKVVTLDHPSQVVTFAITTKAVGPSPVRVSLVAPNGRVIAEQTIVVRSTAINSIALAITIGAGLILALLWARRWFKRPTR